MKRLYKYLFVLLVVPACTPTKTQDKIREFIFIGFSWTYESDFHDPIVVQYMEFNSENNIKIFKMNYHTDKSTYYFSLACPDSLQDILNKTFTDTIYKNEYLPTKDETCIYSGLCFAMFYRSDSINGKTIYYIPRWLPSKINSLYKTINKYFLCDTFPKTEKFNFSTMTDSILSQVPTAMRPPHKAPESLEQKVKFTGPNNEKKYK